MSWTFDGEDQQIDIWVQKLILESHKRMTFSHLRVRAGAMLLAPCLVALLLQACGGGSGGGSGTNDSGGTGTTPSPRSSPSPQSSGTHPPVTQPGQKGTPAPSPTDVPPTEAPTPAMLSVLPGGNIASAAKRVPDGGILVVAPGIYPAVVLNPGDLRGAVTLFADVTGEFTNSPAAAVTIEARSGGKAAIEALSQSGLAIDGFTLRGGSNAGFLCTDCSGITVQDCTVTGSAGDAVRFERSDTALVFNNLLIGNKGRGVMALGTTSLQIINNTIYKNKADGIFLTLDENQNASTNAFLRNNILNKNTPTGIVVDPGPPSSLDGFDADFNLNTDGYSGTDPSPNDAAPDPLFIFPTGGDFHLAQGSQALDSGTDTIDPELVSELQQLTTQTDGTPDTLPPDLGYHYVAPIPTPTRTPKATHTPVPAPTHTAGTVTPPVGTPGTPTPTVHKTKKPTKTPTTTPTPRA